MQNEQQHHNHEQKRETEHKHDSAPEHSHATNDDPKEQLYEDLTSELKKPNKRGWQPYVIGSVALIIVAVVVFFLINNQPAEAPEAESEPEAEVVCETLRKIDGTCYEGENEPGVYAIMIDNHSVARPSSGLAEASLVYETLAEAPITRFLAFYSIDQEVEEIGPVRSARKYFVEWAEEFQAPYFHVGGSPESLLMLKSYDYDVNEFYNGNIFWRDNSKVRPHNTYTSSEKVLSFFNKQGWEPNSDFEMWSYGEELPLEERVASQSVKIDFTNPYYNVKWVYNAENNHYDRYVGDEKVEEQDGDNLSAKNIIVVYAESRVIDNLGRRKTQVLGKGEAVVFTQGQAIEAEWRKEKPEDRIRFYDSEGVEISLLAGTTWLEIIPNHYEKAEY